MLDGRQQVHQPVVVKVVVQVIGIPRRHVALGELGDDRHFPDEIGGEIRAIGASLGQILADVRKRKADHQRHDEQDERAGARVGSRECGECERAGQPPRRQLRRAPITGASMSSAMWRVPTAHNARSPRLLRT